VFELLDTKDFVASERGWSGFTISNGFVGSRKGGVVVTAWREMLDEMLDEMKAKDCYVVNRYGTFGEVSVPKVIMKNADVCHLYTDGTVLPMECKRKRIFSKSMYEHDVYGEVFSKDPIICGLWNAGLSEDVKRASREKLLSSNMFVSEVFRRALGLKRPGILELSRCALKNES
jgi:hypothetical protein